MTSINQTLRFLLIGVVVAHLTAQAAFGQCSDRNCVTPPDGLAPEIAIIPGGPQSYTVPPGGTYSLPVQLGFSDSDGFNQASLRIVLQSGSTSTPLTTFSWTPNADGSYVQSNGTVVLRAGGLNKLTVTIADKLGKSTTAAADYYLSFASADTNVPILSRVHHDHFRNTALGAAVLTYSMPSYTSMDEARSVGLYYDSEQADPSGFVQFDVDTRLATSVSGISLEIVDPATGQAVTTRETWMRHPSGKQRVAAAWRMRTSPTGAYWLRADVRAHLWDGTERLVGQTFRLLVVNQSQSRYGGGWSLAGIQRIHSTSPATESGILINEGNGILRWLARNGTCTTTECRYYVHAGDFSEVIYNVPARKWERKYPNGTKVTFDSNGLQTAVADRFGRTTTYSWFSTGTPPTWLLGSVTDPVGKVTTLTYLNGLLSGIVDPFNRRATFTYQAAITAFHLIRAEGPVTLQAGYDSATNRVSSFTDWRGTWDVVYDPHGAVRQVIAPMVRASDQDIRPTTTYSSIQSVTAPLSGSTKNGNWASALPSNAVYTTMKDPLGHTTWFTQDRYGNVTTVIDSVGRRRDLSWTNDGLPETMSSGPQRVVYSWTTRGQLISIVVNSNPVYSATYELGDQPESETINGVSHRYRYGDRGQLIYKDGWTLEYDGNYRLSVATGPSGQQVKWSYANPWQNVSEIRHVRENPLEEVIESFTYDDAGRIKTASTTPGHVLTYTYDALNRTRQLTDSFQKSIGYDYTGPNLTRVTDPAGKAHTFKYNALGWLEEEGFPDDLTKRTYKYNADGQVIGRTDRRGRSVSATYDSVHRLLGMANADFVLTPADVIDMTFAYPDQLTTVARNKESHQTTQLHSQTGGISLTNIALPPSSGRRYEIATVGDPANWANTAVDVRRYLNDALIGTSSIRQTTNMRPSDTALDMTLSVVDFSGRTTTLGFDSSGRHVRTVFPMNVTQHRSHTKDGRLLSTMYGNATTLNRDLGVSYEYDLSERLSARYTQAGTLRWTYGYDAYDQLTQYRNEKGAPPSFCPPDPDTGLPGNCDPVWTQLSAETYQYDAVGNRTDRAATLWPNSNRYKTFDGYTLEYDQEGNLIRKYNGAGFNQVLTWNALGQLTSVTTNGTRVEYGYSPAGERIRRTQNGQSQYFLYYDGNLLMELDNNGNAVNSYTHAPGIDTPLSVMNAAGSYYYTLGEPGHVTGLLNTSGGIAAHYRYSPFGKIESSFDGVAQSMKFMGRELDATTGLYYVRARWYDPSLARFISSDPIGLAGGINTYAYVGNNPMNALDPSGLQNYACVDEHKELPDVPCVMPPVTVCGNCPFYTMAYHLLASRTLQPRFGMALPAGGERPGLGSGSGMADPYRDGLRAASREATDCFVNAFEADVQAGLFASHTSKWGYMGYSATADLGSIHVGVRNGHLDMWATWGFYGDIVFGGVTFPVGFKVEMTGDENGVAVFKVRTGAERPSADFPFAQGGGIGLGGTATFKAGQWFPCWVRAGRPR